MIRVVVIGAGHRACLYAGYAKEYPQRMSIVAVVEVDEFRRDQFARQYSLANGAVFCSFDSFIAANVQADAVIIASPDEFHYDQTIDSLKAGYHVLLEKPISNSIEQCGDIARCAALRGKVVAVCYPLRYHPLYVRAKELMAERKIGRTIQINHTEYVGIERMTHNFVRGPWNRQERTGTILLSKSCHDMDLIVWLSDSTAKSVASAGSLSWFRAENAPANSAQRCVDCSLSQNRSCPYSAEDIYLRRGEWLRHFNARSQEEVEQELRRGPYGRCVYRCDNTLWDNQVLAMLMDNGVSVSFSLNALTTLSTRRTHIMGSEGEIFVDTEQMELRIRLFAENEDRIEDFGAISSHLHAGADWLIVEEFLKAIERQSSEGLLISIDHALESHRIALMV